MSPPTPQQLCYVRALRWAAYNLEVSADQQFGSLSLPEVEPGLHDALKQVITNLRRQASRLEGRR